MTRQEVLDAMGDEIWTLDDLARAVRGEKINVQSHLNRLLKDGQVQRRGGGRKSKPGRKAVQWRRKPAEAT